jgi:hypothetical protein
VSATSGSAGDSSPDIVELLVTDHARIQELLDAGDRWNVVRELSKHIVAEDQLVYPELRRSTNDADDVLDACLFGDHELESALSDVDKEKVPDLTRVAELFAAHTRTLEDDVFPRMRMVMDAERLTALGAALGDVLSGAPSHPHPHNPDEGPFEVMANMISAEIDQIRDAYHEGKGDR